jgi:hypothetical protein
MEFMDSPENLLENGSDDDEKFYNILADNYKIRLT